MGEIDKKGRVYGISAENSESAGLAIEPYITKGNGAYNGISWQLRKPSIKDSTGKIIFEKEVRAPNFWTDDAVKIVASKYLYKGGKDGTDEKSVQDLVSRVDETIAEEAVYQGLINKKYHKNFLDELCALNIMQIMAFNSPVWFNVGLFKKYGVDENKKSAQSSHFAIVDGRATNEIDAYERPQASACFIQSIEDNMEDILKHAQREGMLFKYGSGTGTNFSTLRGINEPLSGGGVASGQISFMRVYDIIAGRIQSGGKTRRAAKMVISDVDHPDIYRFVNWKASEEKKALWLCANPEWAPRDASDLESEAYKTVDGQNGNNSVRVSDEFMNAVLNNDEWSLNFRTAGRQEKETEIPLEQYKDDRYLPDKRFLLRVTSKKKITKARDLWDQIARAAYIVGDPAIQYKSTINKWNTCKNSGEINASNPCSEFMFLDNSACNLASLNLMKFLKDDGSFDIPLFKHAVRTTIIAQDALVDYGSYPSAEITESSHKFRPLGLGYTNMAAVLMSLGIPYDSEQGRATAAAITALMTGTAYQTSIELAKERGPFQEFEKNKEPMLEVIGLHRRYLNDINPKHLPAKLEDMLESAKSTWEGVEKLGAEHGYRNAQVSLLAPTGTIGFMMGVDCTGIEPMMGLKTTKGLAGGGKMDLKLGGCVKQGLISLGYEAENLESILKHIIERGSVIDAPGLSKEHYPVFATSFGDNTISVDGHLKMMAAVQPFLSGAISKTVNLPKDSTIDDVKETFRKGWVNGLKSVSIYVDGAKGVQPVNLITSEDNSKQLKWGERVRPENPIERVGWNVDIGGTGVHIIVGEYANRKPSDAPADFFIEFGSSGSPYSAAYTSWAKELSRNRQIGGVLDNIIRHNLGANGVIEGFTSHPFIKSCSSIEDFLAKLLKLEYLGQTEHCQVKPTSEQMKSFRCNVLTRANRVNYYSSRIEMIDSVMNNGKVIPVMPLFEDDAPAGMIKSGTPFCQKCGHKTELSGANCYKCSNCGEAPGCG